MKGRFDLLYAGFLCSKDPAMESFGTPTAPRRSGQSASSRRPDYQTMRLRFIEFEQLERRGFRELAHVLIRNARKHDPLIGMVPYFVDERASTQWRYSSTAAPTPRRAAPRSSSSKRKDGTAPKGAKFCKYLLRATDETYNAAKADEVEGPELIEGELPPTVSRLRSGCRTATSTTSSTAGTTTAPATRRRGYGSTPRRRTRPGTEASSRRQSALARYRTAIDYQAFAADEQPYDHISPIFTENIQEALGARPRTRQLGRLPLRDQRRLRVLPSRPRHPADQAAYQARVEDTRGDALRCLRRTSGDPLSALRLRDGAREVLRDPERAAPRPRALPHPAYREVLQAAVDPLRRALGLGSACSTTPTSWSTSCASSTDRWKASGPRSGRATASPARTRPARSSAARSSRRNSFARKAPSSSTAPPSSTLDRQLAQAEHQRPRPRRRQGPDSHASSRHAAPSRALQLPYGEQAVRLGLGKAASR